MVSCIIPIRNESRDLTEKVISNLTDGIDPNELEIVLVNDGSEHPDGSHWNIVNELDYLSEERDVLFINRHEQYGVGYSFDQGVKYCKGDTIVLMGSDVFPEKKSWFTDIKNNTKDKEIGCCCSVGLQPDNYDIDKPGMISRYGATLLYTYTVADLPKSSPLQEDPDYKDIIGARWASKKSDEPYEISSLMGAFYWCKKSFYQEIGGWDTIEGKRFHGHSYWGCLEPFLSIKAKVYGGKCVVYPDIRVGHVFGRIEEKDVYSVRAVRNDFVYWNKLWVAHTMLDDDFRDEVIAFPSFCKDLSQGEVWIKQHWGDVQNARERNRKYGKLISK